MWAQASSSSLVIIFGCTNTVHNYLWIILVFIGFPITYSLHIIHNSRNIKVGKGRKTKLMSVIVTDKSQAGVSMCLPYVISAVYKVQQVTPWSCWCNSQGCMEMFSESKSSSTRRIMPWCRCLSLTRPSWVSITLVFLSQMGYEINPYVVWVNMSWKQTCFKLIHQ